MSPFDPFVGLPYGVRSRGPTAYDCWGLVVEVYRQALGIHLPLFGDAASGADEDRLFREERDFVRPVERAELFDLVLIRERPWHIGLWAGRASILHMPFEGTSIIEPVTRFGRRIEGYYRHVERL
ncbi:hypothetical protein E3C22_16720 [Jiella endophytica]|uniref:NlpC/P60 domain-containing protein n=1 Tax=Jiella endophytica TaxID=2558362 RepID=A0A4Y8REA9_9HYPH|nr:NlpC/P60 family protein [Jiella endophytica]TFF20551.1 hypothetical protein E3C22_16720 [Jiella endophytica]